MDLFHRIWRSLFFCDPFEYIKSIKSFLRISLWSIELEITEGGFGIHLIPPFWLILSKKTLRIKPANMFWIGPVPLIDDPAITRGLLAFF